MQPTYKSLITGKITLILLFIFANLNLTLAQENTFESNLFESEADSTSFLIIDPSALQQNLAIENSTTTTGFTVYFKKPLFWTAAKIHYWNVLPEGTLSATEWPGVDLKPAPEVGQEWYSFTFTNVTSTNLIFNGGMGSPYQTPDLYRDRTGYYNPDRGGWVADPNSPLVIHFKKPSTWSTKAYAHLWNIEPYDSYSNTTWPGIEMTADANLGADWFSLSLSKANCANIVFNDGSGQQTGDLSLCGEGWYDNGWINNTYARTLETDYSDGSFEYIEIENIIGDNFKVYPNPAVSNFTIEIFPQAVSTVEVKVLGINGAEYLKEQVVTEELNSKSINTSSLEKGTYLVTVNDGKTQSVKKILVK